LHDYNYDPRRDPGLRQAGPYPNCPDQPQPQGESNCPVYWTLGGIILLGLRFFLPDLYKFGTWAAGELESKACKELAALKAELANLT
jgi:hypothetical protein